MNGKNLLIGGISGGFINGVFWFLYTQTENIVGSIGITAGVCIPVFGILYKLGKRKTRINNKL